MGMRRLARALVLIGIVVVVLGLSKLHAVRHEYDFTGSFRFTWALAYIVLLWVAAYATGIPDLGRRRTLWLSAAAAAAIGAVGVSIAQLFLGDALLPRFVVFGAALVLVPWYVLCTMVASGGHLREEARDRVVVVGAHDDGETIRLELADGAEHPALVVAALTIDSATGDGSGTEPLVDRAIADDATVVVLARAAQDDEHIVEQVAALHEAGLRIRSLADFYEEWLGKLPIAELERVSLMFDIREVHRLRYARVKRLLDVVLGAVGLVVFLVTLPLVVVGDLLANRGKVFYRQPRVGRDGQRFSIVKYRTMRTAPEGAPNEWTTEDDPRITPFGRLLRRTHFDELPQVINILRGDLSVVGPRPEQPHYVEELAAKIPFYDLRHLVRPGLTGWAQVKFGYAGDERDAIEKLQYDFFYLRHQSLALDLRIMGRTLRELSGRGGR
jgi:lipopolysaccharide/colanic/teichoic acid biosynthesis glycosyltransferase